MSNTLAVTVVTGFLGAGKTTLVNQWLADPPRGDVAVIVNEHGDVGIDGELLAERARVLLEVSGGCICCTTHAELVNALDTMARSSPSPRRILIETSGAASPAGVLRAIVAGGRSGVLALDGVIAVVDATQVEVSLKQALALEQVGYADIVALSRADVCSRQTLHHATEQLAVQNGAAVFVEAAHGQVVSPAVGSLEELLELRRAEVVLAPRLRVPAPPHVYESVSLVHEGELDGERFADFVESEVAEFAGRIFRVKGILAVEGLDARMIVQGVGETVEITFGKPWGEGPRRSRLVIVGFGLDRDALEDGFAACAMDSDGESCAMSTGDG